LGAWGILSIPPLPGTSPGVGSSQNFGSASFMLSAINRIEFDIYNEKLEALRANRDW
jgi:hypothetical protein